MPAVVHPITVRPTRREDFPGIFDLCQKVYPGFIPWTEEYLASHLRVFPEGQLVALEEGSGRVVGMAASLIVAWDDYDLLAKWGHFTADGMFTNHDPRGRTLYGAEVMVRPGLQGRGVGSRLYRARRELVERLKLLRIRAGARLRGYHRHAAKMSAEEYVLRVLRKELRDATLSFQLRHGFRVLAVVPGYLQHDPESQGYAAVIEWISRKVARPEDYAGQDPRFAAPQVKAAAPGPGPAAR